MAVVQTSNVPDSDDWAKESGVITFTVDAGTDSVTQQISQLNAQPYNNSRVTLSIVCASLDATVTLAQLQGNNETFAEMSPILDTQTGLAVSDVLTNGNYVIYSELRAFFLGISCAYGSATTGTITVTIRA